MSWVSGNPTSQPHLSSLSRALGSKETHLVSLKPSKIKHPFSAFKAWFSVAAGSKVKGKKESKEEKGKGPQILGIPGASPGAFCLRSQGQSFVAPGLQRSQEAISTAESLGAARVAVGWVREAQSHPPSRAGRAEIKSAEKHRVWPRKEMRWLGGKILCWGWGWGTGGIPNFERELFRLFIQLLSNTYLWRTYYCLDTARKQSVASVINKHRAQASEPDMPAVESGSSQRESRGRTKVVTTHSTRHDLSGVAVGSGAREPGEGVLYV